MSSLGRHLRAHPPEKRLGKPEKRAIVEGQARAEREAVFPSLQSPSLGSTSLHRRLVQKEHEAVQAALSHGEETTRNPETTEAKTEKRSDQEREVPEEEEGKGGGFGVLAVPEVLIN